MKQQIVIAIALATGLTACGPSTPKGRLLEHLDLIEANLEETHQWAVAKYNEYESEYQQLVTECPEEPEPHRYGRPIPEPLPKDCRWSIHWNLGHRSFRKDECDRERGIWTGRCTRREWTQWIVQQTEPKIARETINSARTLLLALSEEDADDHGVRRTRRTLRLDIACLDHTFVQIRDFQRPAEWNCTAKHVIDVKLGRNSYWY